MTTEQAIAQMRRVLAAGSMTMAEMLERLRRG